jgi:DNA primase
MRHGNDMSEEIILKCPKCPQDKSPKLYVNIDLSVFNCFRCGFKGKLRALYKYPQIITKLEEQLSLSEYNKLKSFKPLDTKNMDVMEDLNPVRELFYEDPQYDYLLSRGWTEDLINIYRPLLSLNPKYNDRVILPVIENEKVIYYTARSLDEKHPRKYINPDHISRKNIIFKSLVSENVLYPQDAVIVEGYFDGCKVPHAVALLGKTLSSENETNLLEFLADKTNIYVCLDFGAETNIKELCKTLSTWFPTKNIYSIDTEKYGKDDLGKLSEHMNPIQLMNWIKNNSILYKTESLAQSLKAKLRNTR